jgi:hypothetical protein
MHASRDRETETTKQQCARASDKTNPSDLHAVRARRRVDRRRSARARIRELLLVLGCTRTAHCMDRTGRAGDEERPACGPYIIGRIHAARAHPSTDNAQDRASTTGTRTQLYICA